MPNVDFTIGDRNYSIACDEGEQEHIKNLAASLNVRVSAIAKTFRFANENLVMAITAIMMEDEIRTLKEAQNQYNNQALNADKVNYAVINAIEPITKYIESLASKLEKD